MGFDPEIAARHWLKMIREAAGAAPYPPPPKRELTEEDKALHRAIKTSNRT